jgi:tellurite resistance protein
MTMTAEERKRAAQALKANPLLEEAFNKAIANCFTAWQASQVLDEREALWSRVKAVQLVRNEVYAAVKSALRDGQQSIAD